MKIAFLAARNCIHAVRWVNEMADRGHDIYLITMHSGGDAINKRIKICSLSYGPPLGYLLNAVSLKITLNDIRPDVLHVHYASGYGTLGRLGGFHPYILSIYGSDVYEFPYRSFINRNLVRQNLSAADWLCSTSEIMARQANQLCPGLKNLTVTPFGVDTGIFRPVPSLRNAEFITIGTVKKLEKKYGIDILIKAFAEVRKELEIASPGLVQKLRLLIVGEGPQKKELAELARRLRLTGVTEFAGAVPHCEVPGYLNRMDIYVAASRLESFGVAVLEASACSLPVVVSDVFGLPEVVKHGITGFVVESQNVSEVAGALIKLIQNQLLRLKMGKAGRERVLQNYKWADNASVMEAVYGAVVKGRRV